MSRALRSPLPNDLRFLICEHLTSPRPHAARRHPSRLLAHARAAHNLSERFKSLENKIRTQKFHYDDTNVSVATPLPSNDAATTVEEEPAEMERMNRGGSKSILRPKPRTFQGVQIPIKPPPPASDVCVYDLYATALEEHDEAMEKARTQLAAKSIPSSEWPKEILSEEDRKKREEEEMVRLQNEGGVEAGRRIGITGESDHERQMAVIIGAFVKFEQSLKEKRREEKSRTQHAMGSSPNGEQPPSPVV